MWYLTCQVHIRIASPPLKYPCYMGINIPTREELIANKMNAAKLAKHVGGYKSNQRKCPELDRFKAYIIY